MVCVAYGSYRSEDVQGLFCCFFKNILFTSGPAACTFRAQDHSAESLQSSSAASEVENNKSMSSGGGKMRGKGGGGVVFAY